MLRFFSNLSQSIKSRFAPNLISGDVPLPPQYLESDILREEDPLLESAILEAVELENNASTLQAYLTLTDENLGKQRNWRLLLVGFFLGSLITVGVFWIYPLAINRAKTLKWSDWTGFGESTTREEIRQRKDKNGDLFTETIKYQSGKTL